MNDILFASNNFGKYLELVDDFKNNGINLIYDGTLKLEEKSELLKDNAISKAVQAAKQKNMCALGDDSGVFIEALDYFPGVHSRRWIGESDDDDCRNEKILEKMIGESDRTAFLISQFALVSSDGFVISTTKVKNEFIVAKCEKGNNGFGYDRILIPSKTMLDDMLQRCPAFSRDDFVYALDDDLYEKVYENQMTIAELTQEEKNKICNRGRIAKKIKESLDDFYNSNEDFF